MKTLLICFLPAIFMMPGNNLVMNAPAVDDKTITLNAQGQQEPGKMRSIVFKSQDYCRAEMPPDFEFDVQFTVVSATVYFSGANFPNVEKGTISSNKLKPIKPLMERCIPGTMVVFDDVKVVGPDKKVRTIPGLSLLLY